MSPSYRAYPDVGAHSDVRRISCPDHDETLTNLEQIGGGYEEHDLAELSLFWMAVRDTGVSMNTMSYPCTFRPILKIFCH